MCLEIRLIPNARTTATTGWRDGELLLRVATPAVDGRANHTATLYLAKLFKVPRSRVMLVSGEKSRHKKFKIVGLETGRKDALLSELLNKKS